MPRITVRLDDEHVTHLDELQGETDAESRSEVVRDVIESHAASDAEAQQYEERLAEYEERIERLQDHVDRLMNEKRLILEREQETTALVEYVEEQQQREGGFARRWWRRLTGEK